MDTVEITEQLGREISRTFRELLENKHLYQSANLEVLRNEKLKKIEKAKGGKTLSRQVDSRWHLGHGTVLIREDGQIAVHFDLQNIKLYCQECKRPEAHNPYLRDGLPHESVYRYELEEDAIGQKIHQWFVVGYECQSCKRPPIVFLIQRKGTKLMLAGRSPIAHVDVPVPIRGKADKFYSDAIIAHQSGQTLAGLFLLRTFIEQMARAVVPNFKGTGDELMKAYAKTLREDVKKSFPSMAHLYSDLSADIHAATGNPKLFEEAVKRINDHFDAKALYARIE